MEKFFKIKEHGSSVKLEIIAGITTFFAMAYIIFVNPQVLSAPAKIMGNDALSQQVSNSVFFATCIASFVGTILMGLLAKLPFAQSSGMGLNAFFAYTVMLTLGYSFSQALALVFISGVLFLAITAFGIREAIVKAIPKNIKIAISGGIGLFIAFVGLKNANIVTLNGATGVSFIDLSKIGDKNAELITTYSASADGMFPTTVPYNSAIMGALLALIGLIIIGVLFKMKVKGSILIGILATTVIGIPMGVTQLPSNPFADFGTKFATQWNDFFEVGFFKFIGGFNDLFAGKSFFDGLLTVVIIVISFSLVDMFDTIGTLLGTAKKADLLDENGEMPGIKKALFCDAIATTTGAMLGTSTVTTYVESSAGISEGGKTGLTSVVTAVLFLLAIPFAPFIEIVPSAATAPALIFVGALMISGIKDIDFDDMAEALPAFLTVAMMPLTYSIANGIAFGLIFHTAIKLFTGKVKSINIITAILSLLFIIRFFMMGM